MVPSSPNDLPEGVEPEELYEGPKVVPLASGRASFLESPPDPREAPAAAITQPIPTAAPRVVIKGNQQWSGGVLPQFPAAPPSTVSTAAVKAAYPAALELAWDVLATRVHFLIALVTACLIWAWVIWDPEPYRMITAGAYSVLVMWPMAWIYWKAGMPGQRGG